MNYHNNVILVFILYNLENKFEKREKKSCDNKYKNI